MKKSNVPFSDLRIIGGQWRGRKLRFAAVEGVRPTGDRIRETLFNWLMFDIEDTRCLDLFAGSGALGFEAASRGAREVVMIDRHPNVVEQLNENAKLLDFMGFDIEKAEAERYLNSKPPAFDIVFLDPPFSEDRTLHLLNLLETNRCLADTALVYVEVNIANPLPELNSHWSVLKEKESGQVRYALLRYKKPEA